MILFPLKCPIKEEKNRSQKEIDKKTGWLFSTFHFSISLLLNLFCHSDVIVETNLQPKENARFSRWHTIFVFILQNPAQIFCCLLLWWFPALNYSNLCLNLCKNSESPSKQILPHLWLRSTKVKFKTFWITKKNKIIFLLDLPGWWFDVT